MFRNVVLQGVFCVLIRRLVLCVLLILILVKIWRAVRAMKGSLGLGPEPLPIALPVLPTAPAALLPLGAPPATMATGSTPTAPPVFFLRTT